MSERPLPQRQAEPVRSSTAFSRRTPTTAAATKPAPAKPVHEVPFEIGGLDAAIAAALGVKAEPPEAPTLAEVEPDPEAEAAPSPPGALVETAPVAPPAPAAPPAVVQAPDPPPPTAPVVQPRPAAGPAPIPNVRSARTAEPATDAAGDPGDDAREEGVSVPRRRPSVALRVALRVLIAAWIGAMVLVAAAFLSGRDGGTGLRSTLPASGLVVPDPLIPPDRR